MRKILYATLILLFSFNFAFSQNEVVYKLNPKKCDVRWSGYKFGTTHEGTLKIKSGTITMKNNVLTDIKVVVDMTTIQNTDLQDKDQKEKLVNHLKSTDFFDVQNFPEATFQSKSISRKLNQDYFIVGKLTIKGKTNEVKLPVTLDVTPDKIKTNVSFTFDRTKYDVRYGSKKFFDKIGDKLIYDDVDVYMYIEAEN